MYSITTDKSRIDVDRIHKFLSEESYWAKNIPRDDVAGFARVVTDYATFAYVGDVFVLAEHRGRGVSKLLMKTIREHPELQTLRRWHLLTSDAHGLYEQFGFEKLSDPQRHMQIAVKNPYRDR